MGELSKLPNIGKTVEEQLNQVGINSADELKSIGAKEAWLKGKKYPISGWLKYKNKNRK